MGGAAAWIIPITHWIAEAWPLSSTLASTRHPRNLAFTMASVRSRVGVQMVTPFAGPRRAACTAVVAQIPSRPDYLRIVRGELTVVRNWIPPPHGAARGRHGAARCWQLQQERAVEPRSRRRQRVRRAGQALPHGADPIQAQRGARALPPHITRSPSRHSSRLEEHARLAKSPSTQLRQSWYAAGHSGAGRGSERSGSARRVVGGSAARARILSRPGTPRACRAVPPPPRPNTALRGPHKRSMHSAAQRHKPDPRYCSVSGPGPFLARHMEGRLTFFKMDPVFVHRSKTGVN